MKPSYYKWIGPSAPWKVQRFNLNIQSTDNWPLLPVRGIVRFNRWGKAKRKLWPSNRPLTHEWKGYHEIMSSIYILNSPDGFLDNFETTWWDMVGQRK